MKKTISNRGDNFKSEPVEPYGLNRKPRRLSAKEKGYIKAIAEGKTRRQAVKDAYDVSPTATVKTLDNMASRIEKRPEVLALITANDELAQQTVIDVMTLSKSYASGGGKDGASYARVALDGANALLDRVHGKAKQSMSVEVKAVNVNVDLSS